MKHRMSAERRLFSATAVMFACWMSGCSARDVPSSNLLIPPAVEDPLPSELVRVHEVRFPGETLAMIASWYTGKEENWKPILDLNRSIAPQRLQIGDLVRIPADLVFEERRLPKSFATDFLRETRRRRVTNGSGIRDHSQPSDTAVLLNDGNSAGDHEDAAHAAPTEEGSTDAGAGPEEAEDSEVTRPLPDPLRDEFIREMLKPHADSSSREVGPSAIVGG